MSYSPLTAIVASSVVPHPNLDLLLVEIGDAGALAEHGIRPLALLESSLDARAVGAVAQLAGFGGPPGGPTGELSFLASEIAGLDGDAIRVDGDGRGGACRGIPEAPCCCAVAMERHAWPAFSPQATSGLVPAPFFNTVRYGGVLAPAAAVRSQVIPAPAPNTHRPGDTDGTRAPEHDQNGTKQRRSRWRPWAELLKRSFDIDLRCPRCNATMKLKSFLTRESCLHRLLTELGRAPFQRSGRSRRRHYLRRPRRRC